MSFPALPFHVLVGPFNPPAMLDQKWFSSCLSDPRCLGAYLHHPQIHPFFTASEVFAHSLVPGASPQAEAALPGPRLSPGENFYLQPVIDEARRQHPVDMVLWWGLQNGFPLDLAILDSPLFVVMSDWHNHKPLARLLQGAAGIFCDEKLRQRLLQEHSGFSHKVKYWPAYSFEPSLIASVTRPVERDIDVLFVGNTNPHKYVQRNQLLFRIANLPQVKLHVASGVSEAEHLALLQRSKIAFNHSLRQEMNLRAYEATACGALLLMESDNLEIHRFLQPGIAYVPYTPQNLEAQIQYYLAHPKARERIAQQGQQAIQSCHYSARFAALLDMLKADWEPRGERAPSRPAHDEDDLLLAHALVHVTSDLSVLRVHAAHQLAGRAQQLRFANGLLVALADLWVHPVAHEAAPPFSLQAVQRSLDKTLFSGQHGGLPLQMLVAYNLAWSYFFQADYVNLERVLLCFQVWVDRFSWPVFTQEVASSFFVLPVRYTGFYLLYQEAAAESQDALQDVLMAGFAFLQACLQRSQGKSTEAIVSFERCIHGAPRLVEAYFELAGVWIEQQHYLRAEQCLAQGLYQGIFFKGAWTRYFELLRQRTLSLAEEHQRVRLMQALQHLSF